MTGAQQPDPTAFQVLVHLNRPDLLCVICPGTARTFLHSIKARKNPPNSGDRQNSRVRSGMKPTFPIVVSRYHSRRQRPYQIRPIRQAQNLLTRKTLGFSLVARLLQNSVRFCGLCIAERSMRVILHLPDANSETPNEEIRHELYNTP